MSTDIHALSGAYAVDALDDAERADFERHLAECEACRDEVADLQAAAAEIAVTTEATPPSRLRAGVLAGIAHVRPLPPLHAEPAPVLDNVRPFRRKLWQQVGLAAAAAAIVAGGTTVALHPWDTTTAQHHLSAADQVVQAPDVQRYSSDLAGGASVVVYRSVALDRAVVVTHGLAKPAAGKVYELWLQARSGTLVPAGTFANGSDLRRIAQGKAGAAKALGITVEPAGGSKIPTTQPIVLVHMT